MFTTDASRARKLFQGRADFAHLSTLTDKGEFALDSLSACRAARAVHEAKVSSLEAERDELAGKVDRMTAGLKRGSAASAASRKAA